MAVALLSVVGLANHGKALCHPIQIPRFVGAGIRPLIVHDLRVHLFEIPSGKQ